MSLKGALMKFDPSESEMLGSVEQGLGAAMIHGRPISPSPVVSEHGQNGKMSESFVEQT